MLHKLPAYCSFTVLFLLIVFSPFTSLFASDEPFTYPSNWGFTGLLEIPTARVLEENRYRAGVGQVEPYRYYYITISPFPRLELNGRITEELDVPSGLVNQKNFKDKAVDIKYQLIREGKYTPALTLGIMDPHGTRVFPSQYIVASKQIYPFDFTLGLGNGRFGERPLTNDGSDVGIELLKDPVQWLNDSQFFFGIQFAPSEKYALMLEYSPVKYHKQTGDPARQRYFTDPVPSNFNFGLRYRPTSWSEIDISYQRGNEIGVSLSVDFEIGNPLIPIYDPVYRENPSDKMNPPRERITKSLHQSGFSDIGIMMNSGKLTLEAQNDKYFYTMRALGVMLSALAHIIPEHIETVNIILKENGIPIAGLYTDKINIVELYEEKLTLHEFLALSELRTDVSGMPDIKTRYKNRLKYGLKPDLQTFLNDPSGFFKFRFGVAGWASYHPWNGASFIAGLATYPVNTITTTNEPLSIPVRTDNVLYKQEKVVLSRLIFEQMDKLTPNLYGRIAAGLLEVQYAGVDAELAAPVLDGRFILGISGSAVKKRRHDSILKLKSNDVKDYYTTAFFKTRLNMPEQEIALDIQAGRFLAGDKGVRFTVSKHIKGVTLWAWYTVTDTSVFTDRFNRGYRDKGIGVSIPLRLFEGTDTKTVHDFSLSPWTRDTGQDINHFRTLFDFIGRNVKIFLDKDKGKLY